MRKNAVLNIKFGWEILELWQKTKSAKIKDTDCIIFKEKQQDKQNFASGWQKIKMDKTVWGCFYLPDFNLFKRKFIQIYSLKIDKEAIWSIFTWENASILQDFFDYMWKGGKSYFCHVLGLPRANFLDQG